MYYAQHRASPLACPQQPLNAIELQRIAPAVFADAPHHSRSEKYVYVPTKAVLDKLGDVGFRPYQVSVAKVRDKVVTEREVVNGITREVTRHERSDRWGFQKHLVRLRHESNLAGAKGGIPELVLINAHDGTCAWQMLAGWFEFLCANGLMIGDTSAEFRVRHKGDKLEVLRKIASGAHAMLEHMAKIEGAREAMRACQLTWGEQQAFAKAALQLRYGGEDADGKLKEIPLEPYQLLRPKRPEEAGGYEMTPQARTVGVCKDDLWTTFNVVQEHIIRGGTMGTTMVSGRRRIRRQRGVNGIDQSTAVNRALWTLADEMKKLKGGCS